MRKIKVVWVVFFLLLGMSKFSFSQEDEARKMADKYHKLQEEMLGSPDLVTPDSIYTTSELKAIYYQNQQVIGLLEEIKGLLRQNLEKE
ncbi:MAG: hypothetical protein ABH836_00965 [Candidatus Omnitrophota bacterium]